MSGYKDSRGDPHESAINANRRSSIPASDHGDDDLENLPDDCGNLEIALMPLENWEGHEIVTVKRWFPKMYMNRG